MWHMYIAAGKMLALPNYTLLFSFKFPAPKFVYRLPYNGLISKGNFRAFDSKSFSQIYFQGL